MPDGFLSRWARLKREHERTQGAEAKDAPQAAPPAVPADAPVKQGDVRGGQSVDASLASLAPRTGVSTRRSASDRSKSPPASESATPASKAATPASEAAAPASDPNLDLPPLESLTPASDFTPFLRAGVASATRSAALKTLFQDPHFNVMDGLDIYIDDYTKSDPIPESLLRRLVHSKTLGLFDEPEKEAPVGSEQGEGGAAQELVAAAPAEMPEDQPDGDQPDGDQSDRDQPGGDWPDEAEAAAEPIDPPESPVDAPAVRIDSSTKTA